MINVLFNVRGDYLIDPGGDTVQILKTAEELEKLGLKIHISPSLQTDLSPYDIVHLFNLTRVRETHAQCEHAKKFKKPIALSTIYWNMKELNKKGLYKPYKRLFHQIVKSDTIRLRLKKATTSLFKVKFQSPERLEANTGLKIQQEYILKNSDILLPNSEMEMNQLKKDFGLKKKYMVVPNAADSQFHSASPVPFLEKYDQYGLKKDNFVLCVTRIEDRKNILRLIKAANKTRLKLMVIGRPNPTQLPFYNKCRKAAKQNIIFLGHLSHDELRSAYAAAKAHIMPSWYETPGLSSLEAGLAGCNIATTERGATREYFKDMAVYCNPASVESIKGAMVQSFNKPKSRHLSEHILKHYTWEKTAEQTLKAYRQILKQ